MAASNLSAQKRIRQSDKRRLMNKSLKSSLKTQFKLLEDAVESKNKKDALEILKGYVSMLDKAVKHNVLHKNNADRKKSRIMKMINSIKKVQKKESSAE
ncbi:MAG: 30S ribosomal protein S20 [Spirochaetes bacterium]|nr:30S ribosomal protein S20 [Spirochaetota bacterium]